MRGAILYGPRDVRFDEEPLTIPLVLGRRRIAESPIGGIRETQEMLDFCARKNILPDCEMIRMDQINKPSSVWSVGTSAVAS
jgi:D-arabinose 1-dehydrogenase-like Zn-dependent alcohol dehydrogenase